MALIFLAGAAYAGYMASQSGELEEDDQINLDGKQSVSLLPLEQTLGYLEMPIATATFFNGNYKDAAEHLSHRVKEILAINPWLGGWVGKEKGEQHIKLYYDETGERTAWGTFQVFEPGEIDLNEDTPYSKYHEIGRGSGGKVPQTHKLVGKDEAIWRVSVVPFADNPETRFALVVSLSHVGGDTHTYYQLYNMLSKDSEVIALNPKRRLEFSEILTDEVGKDEANYIKNTTTNPLWEWNKAGVDPTESRIFSISNEWLKEMRGDEPPSEVENEELVRIKSVLSHWFFQQLKPTVGFINFNFRDEIPRSRVSYLDAGNYFNPIPMLEEDYATPELIEKTLTTHKRCGSCPPMPLPGFKWDATFSILANFSSSRLDRMNLGETVDETMHYFLFTPEDLKLIPNKLSVLMVFTMHPESKDGSMKRQFGAVLSAPRSLVEKMETSGVMDKIVAKF